jgi:hypothetical protein
MGKIKEECVKNDKLSGKNYKIYNESKNVSCNYPLIGFFEWARSGSG